jgi:hypothetical protein
MFSLGLGESVLCICPWSGEAGPVYQRAFCPVSTSVVGTENVRAPVRPVWYGVCVYNAHTQRHTHAQVTTCVCVKHTHTDTHTRCDLRRRGAQTRTCARARMRRADTRKLTHRPVCTHTRTCHLQVKLFVGADDAASLLARLRSF